MGIAAHGHLEVTRSVRIGDTDVSGRITAGEAGGNVTKLGITNGSATRKLDLERRLIGRQLTDGSVYLRFQDIALIERYRDRSQYADDCNGYHKFD